MVTKGWLKKQAVWRHNGFMGSARMMQMQAIAIQKSDTATDEAKRIAAQIEIKALDLAEALRKRKDQM